MSRWADAAAVARWAIFVAIVALAAFLRFDGLGRPSYWLDEILGDQLTTSAAAAPAWKWLTGLEAEHGPLYYATQLATRIAGRDEAAGRLAAAVFGLITIPLVWFAAIFLRSRSSTRSTPEGGAGTLDFAILPVIAAILLAISPLHVYYSREARPYALVILLTAGLILAMLRGPSVMGAGILLVALLYTSAVALPVVAAAAVTSAIAAWQTRDDTVRKRMFLIAGVAVAVAVLFLSFYRGASPRIETAFPPSPWAVVEEICRALSVSALGAEEHGRTTVAMMILAIVGAVALARRNRNAAVILGGMTLLPAVFAVLSLRFLGHWFAVRYIGAAIAGFVLLVASGIAYAGQLVAMPLRRRRRAAAIAICCAVTIAIASQTWAAARREPFEKLDWRAIGAALERHVRSGDALVFADPWADVCARYYIHHLQPGVRAALTSPHMSQILTMTHDSVWFVSDGAAPTALRSWACRFPLVLSTKIESVHVHYAPSVARYIGTRALTEDLRAVAEAAGARGFAVSIGVGDDAIIGDGWGTPEGGAGQTFRWAIGTQASIVAPLWGARDRAVRVHAMPAAPAGGPQQRITLAVNGRSVAEAAMVNGWHDYEFEVPSSAWIDGVNTIAFRFARAVEPASVDPRSSDHRALAACFDFFAVHDRGAPVPSVSPVPAMPTASFASTDLLDARGVERGDRTRFPAGHLERAGVEAFLGRLGIDPQAAWPLLANDRLHVEDVAETIATGSGCEDDRAFLDRAFAVMVQRRPNSVEERDLLERMRRGATREHIVRRIADADDFRERMLTP